jgi:undecaprenyl-diphosphatase
LDCHIIFNGGFIITLFEAIVLGIIQGLTEFLPISSTAHIRIIPLLFGWQDPGAAITAEIQIGTMIALLVYFFHDIWEMIIAGIKSVVHLKPMETKESRMGWFIVIGTFPIVILGFLFKHHIETTARSLYMISFSLIFFAIILWIAEKTAKMNKDITKISWFESQIVGFAQALALIPGASRSGVTLTGGLFAGLTRETAARFSFLLSIPAVFASSILEIWEVRHLLGEAGTLNLVISIIVSGITGYLAIDFLLRYLRKHNTFVFIYYRIILGSILLVLLFMGIVKPF